MSDFQYRGKYLTEDRREKRALAAIGGKERLLKALEGYMSSEQRARYQQQAKGGL